MALPGITPLPCGRSLLATNQPPPASFEAETCAAWLSVLSTQRLTVRRPEIGDRFRPLGASGAKRLSRISSIERFREEDGLNRIVVEGADGLVWVRACRSRRGCLLRSLSWSRDRGLGWKATSFDLDHLAGISPAETSELCAQRGLVSLGLARYRQTASWNEIYQVAERLIEPVNGYGSLTHSDFRPVRLTRIYDDETGITVVPGAAHLEIRVALSGNGTVTDANGNVKSPEASPGPDRIALVGSNSDVEEVLGIMSRIPLKWLDLRKVHEIICRSVEPTTIVKLRWTTSDKDSTFTSSASNPAISGSDAVHARPPKGNQPKRKMSISEGRQYVRELVTKWLDHLVSQP